MKICECEPPDRGEGCFSRRRYGLKFEAKNPAKNFDERKRGDKGGEEERRREREMN